MNSTKQCLSNFPKKDFNHLSKKSHLKMQLKTSSTLAPHFLAAFFLALPWQRTSTTDPAKKLLLMSFKLAIASY